MECVGGFTLTSSVVNSALSTPRAASVFTEQAVTLHLSTCSVFPLTSYTVMYLALIIAISRFARRVAAGIMTGLIASMYLACDYPRFTGDNVTLLVAF